MAQDGGDFTREIDEENDRMCLRRDGMLDAETAHAAADASTEGAEMLDPGFGLVTDNSTYKPMSQEATEAIERGKRDLAENDVGAVVRVVGDSVVGKMQFDRVGEGDESYHVARADSREQAERFLDEFESERPVTRRVRGRFSGRT